MQYHDLPMFITLLFHHSHVCFIGSIWMIVVAFQGAVRRVQRCHKCIAALPQATPAARSEEAMKTVETNIEEKRQQRSINRSRESINERRGLGRSCLNGG